MLLRVFALTWFASGAARLGGLLGRLGASSLFPVKFFFIFFQSTVLVALLEYFFICKSHLMLW